MFKRKSKSFFLVFTIFVSLFVTIYLLDSVGSPLTDNNLLNDNGGFDSVSSSSSGLPYQVSPFFNHTDPDRNVYADLVSDDLSLILYRHAFNNSDDFEILDSNITAADQFYYLMGLQQLTGAYLIPTFVDWQKSSKLWDNESIHGGYFVEMDENKTTISNEKTLFDNVLAILAAYDGLTGTTSLDPKDQIEEQWNTVVNLFWDSDDSLFNHSISDGEKYSADNLLAAIAAFKIASASELNDDPILQQDAFNKGDAIMTELNSSLYDPNDNWEGYFRSETSSTDKNLLPNALGISALLYWNIADGYKKNSSYIVQAERLYSFFKTNLFNNTNNMYNLKMDQTGSGGYNYHLNLLENAWMLTAILDLFKSTSDITYYNDAIELFRGIENTLYDETNKGYHNSYYGAPSEIKTFDSYNMLISSLIDMKEIYDSAQITSVVNKSEYLYLSDTQFNVSINVNYSMEFDFNSSVAESTWNLSVALDTAPLKYTLRYSDNNTIIQSQFAATDSEGDTTYYYPMAGLPVTDYKLSILCNYSTYCFTYISQPLTISSALIIPDYEPLFDSLYQGQTRLINVSIGSLRKDNITVNVGTDGDNFNPGSVNDILITNESLSYAVVNLTAKLDSETGQQTFTVNLYNNSFIIATADFTVNIKPAVQVEYLNYREYIIEDSNLSITLVIRNRKTDESESNLHVEITGDYFDTIDEDLSTIAANSLKSYSFDLLPSTSIPYGNCHFTVNVSRAGSTVIRQTYSVRAVPSIEILSIEASSLIIHGHKPYLSVDVNNYLSQSDDIEIKANGNSIWSGKIKSGLTTINTIVDRSISNPYSIEDKSYQIEVYNSDDELIATKTITVSQEISISNVFFFYVLPIIVPTVAIVIFKYKDIENEKRLK